MPTPTIDEAIVGFANVVASISELLDTPGQGNQVLWGIPIGTAQDLDWDDSLPFPMTINQPEVSFMGFDDLDEQEQEFASTQALKEEFILIFKAIRATAALIIQDDKAITLPAPALEALGITPLPKNISSFQQNIIPKVKTFVEDLKIMQENYYFSANQDELNEAFTPAPGVEIFSQISSILDPDGAILEFLGLFGTTVSLLPDVRSISTTSSPANSVFLTDSELERSLGFFGNAPDYYIGFLLSPKRSGIFDDPNNPDKKFVRNNGYIPARRSPFAETGFREEHGWDKPVTQHYDDINGLVDIVGGTFDSNGIEIPLGTAVYVTEIVEGAEGLWVGFVPFPNAQFTEQQIKNLTLDYKYILYTRPEFIRKSENSANLSPEPLLKYNPSSTISNSQLEAAYDQVGSGVVKTLHTANKLANEQSKEFFDPQGQSFSWTSLKKMDFFLQYVDFGFYNEKEYREIIAPQGPDGSGPRGPLLRPDILESNTRYKFSSGYYYFIVGDGSTPQLVATSSDANPTSYTADGVPVGLSDDEAEAIRAGNLGVVSEQTRNAAFNDLLRALGKDTTPSALLNSIKNKYFAEISSAVNPSSISDSNQRVLYAVPASYIEPLPDSKAAYDEDFLPGSQFLGGKNYIANIKLQDFIVENESGTSAEGASEQTEHVKSIVAKLEEFSKQVQIFEDNGGTVLNPKSLPFDMQTQIDAFKKLPTILRAFLQRQAAPYSDSSDLLDSLIAESITDPESNHRLEIGLKDNGKLGEDVRLTISYVLFIPDPESQSTLRSAITARSSFIDIFDAETNAPTGIGFILRRGLDFLRNEIAGLDVSTGLVADASTGQAIDELSTLNDQSSVMGTRSLFYLMHADYIKDFSRNDASDDPVNKANKWVYDLQEITVPPLLIWYSKKASAANEKPDCSELYEKLQRLGPNPTEEELLIQETYYRDCLDYHYDKFKKPTPATGLRTSRVSLESAMDKMSNSKTGGMSKEGMIVYRAFLNHLDPQGIMSLMMACFQHKLGLPLTAEAICEYAITKLVEADFLGFSKAVNDFSPVLAAALGLTPTFVDPAKRKELEDKIDKNLSTIAENFDDAMTADGKQPPDEQASTRVGPLGPVVDDSFAGTEVATALAILYAQTEVQESILGNDPNVAGITEAIEALRRAELKEYRIDLVPAFRANQDAQAELEAYERVQIERERKKLLDSGYSSRQTDSILILNGLLRPSPTQIDGFLTGPNNVFDSGTRATDFLNKTVRPGRIDGSLSTGAPGLQSAAQGLQEAKAWVSWAKRIVDLGAICEAVVGPLLKLPGNLLKGDGEGFFDDYARRLQKYFDFPKPKFNLPDNLPVDNRVGDYNKKLLEAFLGMIGMMLGQVANALLRDLLERCFEEEDPQSAGSPVDSTPALDIPSLQNRIAPLIPNAPRADILAWLTALLDRLNKAQLCSLLRREASTRLLNFCVDYTRTSHPLVYQSGIDSSEQIKNIFAILGEEVGLDICNTIEAVEAVLTEDACGKVEYNTDDRINSLMEAGLTQKEAQLQTFRELQAFKDKIFDLGEFLFPNNNPLENKLPDICGPNGFFVLPPAIKTSMKKITDNMLAQVKGALISDMADLKFLTLPPKAITAANNPDQLLGSFADFTKNARDPYKKLLFAYVGPGRVQSVDGDNFNIDYGGMPNYQLCYNESVHYNMIHVPKSQSEVVDQIISDRVDKFIADQKQKALNNLYTSLNTYESVTLEAFEALVATGDGDLDEGLKFIVDQAFEYFLGNSHISLQIGDDGKYHPHDTTAENLQGSLEDAIRQRIQGTVGPEGSALYEQTVHKQGDGDQSNIYVGGDLSHEIYYGGMNNTSPPSLIKNLKFTDEFTILGMPFMIQGSDKYPDNTILIGKGDAGEDGKSFQTDYGGGGANRDLSVYTTGSFQTFESDVDLEPLPEGSGVGSYAQEVRRLIQERSSALSTGNSLLRVTYDSPAAELLSAPGFVPINISTLLREFPQDFIYAKSSGPLLAENFEDYSEEHASFVAKFPAVFTNLSNALQEYMEKNDLLSVKTKDLAEGTSQNGAEVVGALGSPVQMTGEGEVVELGDGETTILYGPAPNDFTGFNSSIIDGISDHIKSQFAKDLKPMGLENFIYSHEMLVHGQKSKYRPAAVLEDTLERGPGTSWGLKATPAVNHAKTEKDDLRAIFSNFGSSLSRTYFSLDTKLKDISPNRNHWYGMLMAFTGVQLDGAIDNLNKYNMDSHPGSYEDEGDTDRYFEELKMFRASPGLRFITEHIAYVNDKDHNIIDAFMEFTLGEASGITEERVSAIYPNLKGIVGNIKGVMLTKMRFFCDTVTYEGHDRRFLHDAGAAVGQMDSIPREPKPKDDSESYDGNKLYPSIMPLAILYEEVFRDPTNAWNQDADTLLNLYSMDTEPVSEELKEALENYSPNGFPPYFGFKENGMEDYISGRADNDFALALESYHSFNPNTIKLDLPVRNISVLSVDAGETTKRITDLFSDLGSGIDAANDDPELKAELSTVSEQLGLLSVNSSMIYQNFDSDVSLSTLYPDYKDAYFFGKGKFVESDFDSFYYAVAEPSNSDSALVRKLNNAKYNFNIYRSQGLDMGQNVSNLLTNIYTIDPPLNPPYENFLPKKEIVDTYIETIYPSELNYTNQITHGADKIVIATTPDNQTAGFSTVPDLLPNMTGKLPPEDPITRLFHHDKNTRAKIFGRLITKKLEKAFLDNGGTVNQDALAYIEHNLSSYGYSAMKMAYSNQAFAKLKSSRLNTRKMLRKIWDKILQLPENSSASQECKDLFDRINLSTTKDLIKTNTDFFNVSKVKNLILDSFEKAACRDVFNPETPRDSAARNALLEGSIIVLIKVYCLEMCLASVFAWDSFNLRDVFSSKLMTRVIVQNIKEGIVTSPRAISFDDIANVASQYLIKKIPKYDQYYAGIIPQSPFEKMVEMEANDLAGTIQNMLPNSNPLTTDLTIDLVKNSDPDFAVSFDTKFPSFVENEGQFLYALSKLLSETEPVDYVVGARITNNPYTINIGRNIKSATVSNMAYITDNINQFFDKHINDSYNDKADFFGSSLPKTTPSQRDYFYSLPVKTIYNNNPGDLSFGGIERFVSNSTEVQQYKNSVNNIFAFDDTAPSPLPPPPSGGTNAAPGAITRTRERLSSIFQGASPWSKENIHEFLVPNEINSKLGNFIFQPFVKIVEQDNINKFSVVEYLDPVTKVPCDSPGILNIIPGAQILPILEDYRSGNNQYNCHLYGYVPLNVWTDFYQNVFLAQIEEEPSGRLKKLFARYGLEPFFKSIEIGIRMTYIASHPIEFKFSGFNYADFVNENISPSALEKTKSIISTRATRVYGQPTTGIGVDENGAVTTLVNEMHVPIVEVSRELKFSKRGFIVEGNLESQPYSKLGSYLLLDASTVSTINEFIMDMSTVDSTNEQFNMIDILSDVEDVQAIAGLVKSFGNNFSQLFYKDLAQELIDNLKATAEFKLIFDHLLPIKDYSALAFLYGGDSLSPLIKESSIILEQTKNTLNNIVDSLFNDDQFDLNPDILTARLEDTLKADQTDTRGKGTDLEKEIAKIILRTPLLVLKGFVEVTDPAIILAKLIIDIANSVQQAAIAAAEAALNAAKQAARGALRESENAKSQTEIQVRVAASLAQSTYDSGIKDSLESLGHADAVTFDVSADAISDWQDTVKVNDSQKAEIKAKAEEDPETYEAILAFIETVESLEELIEVFVELEETVETLKEKVAQIQNEIDTKLAEAKKILKDIFASPFLLPGLWAAMVPTMVPLGGGLIPPPPGLFVPTPPSTIPGMIYLAILFIDGVEQAIHNSTQNTNNEDNNCSDEL